MAARLDFGSSGSSSSTTIANCLQFSGYSAGVSTPLVDCGIRYRGGEVENNEGFYDMIARVEANGGGYVFVESVSGAHFMMLGLSSDGSTPARNVLIGNFWGSDDAAYPTGSYSSAEGPLNGEWGHHAAVIGPDASNTNVYLTTYWNGLVTGRWFFWTVASGKTRKMRAAGNTQGSLYFGASGDHNGFTGRLVAARAFDRKRPIEYGFPFVPPRTLGNVYGSVSNPNDYTYDFCDGLWTFDNESALIDDLSRGFDQGLGGALYKSSGTLTNWYVGQTPPTWVRDETCPHGKTGDLTTAAQGYIGYGSSTNPITAPSLPTGARIYDDFARAPQDWFWMRGTGPSMGPTRSDASLGAKTWEQHMVGGNDVDNWVVPIAGRAGAIRNRYCRTYANQPWIAYVDNGQADMDVRISRMNSSDMGYTGIAYRVQDRQNFWAVHTLAGTNGSNNRDIYSQKFTAGGGSGLGVSFTPAANWTTLRIVVSGNTHTFYVDNGAGGWTNLGNFADASYNTQTKVGVVATQSSAVGGGGSWNGTDFTVI